MHFVYILVSQKDERQHYVGSSNNIQRRLKEHNAKSSTGYTKQFAPWRIKTYIAFEMKKQAEEFEKYLKSGSGYAFLKRRLI